MPFKIVRNDITHVKVDVIVNTANSKPIYASGTDLAVYQAAGAAKLLAYHKEVFVLYVFIRYTNSKDVSFHRKGCRNGRRDLVIWREHWE